MWLRRSRPQKSWLLTWLVFTVDFIWKGKRLKLLLNTIGGFSSGRHDFYVSLSETWQPQWSLTGACPGSARRTPWASPSRWTTTRSPRRCLHPSLPRSASPRPSCNLVNIISIIGGGRRGVKEAFLILTRARCRAGNEHTGSADHTSLRARSWAIWRGRKTKHFRVGFRVLRFFQHHLLLGRVDLRRS